jgi:hypothetical protein
LVVAKTLALDAHPELVDDARVNGGNDDRVEDVTVKDPLHAAAGA